MSGASQHGGGPTRWSVIVLTGGASTRMGRDKATLAIDGQTLLERTLSGVPEAVPVLVAGPAVPLRRSNVAFAREEPPGGGPVAGLDAALGLAGTDVVVVLATDLPFVGELPRALADELLHADASVDAVLAVDAEGRSQQLCGAYRADALRSAIAAGGAASGASMRGVVARLNTRTLEVGAAGGPIAASDAMVDPVRDIDTPQDLAETFGRGHLAEQQGGSDE
ncbi:MAG: molybdenum cofactor guanylyltransferase [Actinomycetes bacterium]